MCHQISGSATDALAIQNTQPSRSAPRSTGKEKTARIFSRSIFHNLRTTGLTPSPAPSPLSRVAACLGDCRVWARRRRRTRPLENLRHVVVVHHIPVLRVREEIGERLFGRKHHPLNPVLIEHLQ